MRHIVWLAGCLLVLSCTLNNDNLNTGAGGSGGGTGGVGGCPRCVGTGGETASGGQIGTGGTTATGGQVGTGGQSGTGGTTATGGQIGTGGASATGGKTGTGGSKGCDALETDYGNALTTAKKCTLGTANQCQQLVDGSLSCPGCKQYVNDATMLSAIQTAWDNQNCSSVPHACPAIACVLPTTSVCTSNPTAGGTGPGPNLSGTCGPPLTPAN